MKYKRIVVIKTGGPDVLRLVEEEKPLPSGNVVLVRILAAGVSFADVLMREGVYRGMPELPFTPGYDIVGVVEKVGEKVSRVKEGSYVAALCFTGGYAEYILLPENELVLVPSAIEPAMAVSLVLNYVTAYQMLHRTAKIKDGSSILVYGAAGGVGTALLQLGSLQGLRMIGTASAAKHKLVDKLGAIPVDYTNSTVIEQLRSLQPDGYDVILDGTGEWGFPSYKLLHRNGLLIIYGVSSLLEQGRKKMTNMIKTYFRATVLLKALLPSKKRVVMYQITKMKQQHAEFFRQDLQILFGLLTAGKINPIINTKRPLCDAAWCHEQLNKAQVVGKIILVNE